ncbi:hypothetical protein DV451_001123 [Geotrichum candidum]|uniref:Uncharacterized protein n=1 Tax=Geotrichum candidum TaxID=1173061 RepID=A0A9P5KU15_GEOCN|nr:hypothetical protein DV451_001123 [Geotrichum candidum]KAF5109900.1 hypothetical protein DV453_001191 [Geotrichum candidum]
MSNSASASSTTTTSSIWSRRTNHSSHHSLTPSPPPPELDPATGRLVVQPNLNPAHNLYTTVPTQAPLHHNYTVWFMHRGPGIKMSNYFLATKQVSTFSTVEEFWLVYSHLKRVDRLPFTSEFQVFRRGVKPMWEDPVNLNGGKWVFRFKRPFKPQSVDAGSGDDEAAAAAAAAAVNPRNQARLYWELLLLNLIGGNLASRAGLDGNEIVGLVMSVRRDEDIFSIWTRTTATATSGGGKIEQVVRDLLNLPADIGFEFKVHTDSIKEGEQKQALYYNNNNNNNNPNAAATPTTPSAIGNTIHTDQGGWSALTDVKREAGPGPISATSTGSGIW